MLAARFTTVPCRRLGGLAGSEGARPSSGLRSALQQQCRVWLDALHSRSMAHLNGAQGANR
jgi:hypothetical protein